MNGNFRYHTECLVSQLTLKLSLHARTCVSYTTYMRALVMAALIYWCSEIILKFRRNPTIRGELMTLYRFFKMAAMKSEIYFRVRIWWWHSFGWTKMYWHTKFDEISQSTAEIELLPFSENRRPPFWNYIFGFYFCLLFVIGVSFCKIELPLAELWRHIEFFKMAASSHIGFDLDNMRPSWKCNCWSQIGPQIWYWLNL